jgi:prepilin-type processing-associated H-X9-DG protein
MAGFFSDTGGDGRGFTLPNGKAGSTGYFTTDSAVMKPAQTPVFFDENWSDTWPVETDAPAHDLYQGSLFNQHVGVEIGRLTIARHGSLIPSDAPRNLTGNAVLPGAINMSFYDGHVELVKLEKLWTFYWYVGCTPLSSGHPIPQ